MKAIRLLCGLCFLMLFSFPLQAQLDSERCVLDWKIIQLHQESGGGSQFFGSGSAFTTLTNFYGSGVNGWVNYVVEGTSSYEMTLRLGTTSYTIVYMAPQHPQDGFLEVFVDGM